jgi:hypothetical protein
MIPDTRDERGAEYKQLSTSGQPNTYLSLLNRPYKFNSIGAASIENLRIGTVQLLDTHRVSIHLHHLNTGSLQIMKLLKSFLLVSYGGYTARSSPGGGSPTRRQYEPELATYDDACNVGYCSVMGAYVV